MKTYNMLLLIALLGTISFSACRRIESEEAQQKPEPQSLIKYFDFVSHERKGLFIFSTHGNFWSPRSEVAQTMRGYFSDKDGNDLKGGKIKFGNFVLEPIKEPHTGGTGFTHNYRLPEMYSNDRHAAIAAFGATLDIEMAVPVVNPAARGESTKTLTGSFYVPKEIMMIKPARREGDTSVFIVKDGYRLQWNEDEKNLKGIVIYLEYDPGEGQNNFTHKKDYPERINKVINTKDVSEGYVIKGSDLADFPNGCRITIRVARTNYITLKDGEDNYDVAALTLVRGGFKVAKAKD